MDRVFNSRTGAEDAILLEQARRDVGLNHDLEEEAIRAAAAEGKDTAESHVEKAWA